MKIDGDIGREFALVVVGAIVLTASLMWKDYIVDVQQRLFPDQTNLINKLLFTVLLTLVFVVILVAIRRKFDVKQPE